MNPNNNRKITSWKEELVAQTWSMCNTVKEWVINIFLAPKKPEDQWPRPPVGWEEIPLI